MIELRIFCPPFLTVIIIIIRIKLHAGFQADSSDDFLPPEFYGFSSLVQFLLEMQSTLLCLGVVLFLLAPSTWSFSRGANHASCQEMVPGHIRAQPQSPQLRHVSLRTSSSSYLPGQLITGNQRFGAEETSAVTEGVPRNALLVSML